MRNEKRKHIRWSAKSPVQVKGASGTVDGQLNDISLGGARVVVEARSRLPDGPHALLLPGSDGPVELSAELVREEPAKGLTVLGFRFVEADATVLAPLVDKLRID